MSVVRTGFVEISEVLGRAGAAYLDVRTVEEFAQGHPAGAFNIPVFHRGPGGMAPNPDFVRQVQAAFAPDTPLVVGCRSGQRSATAAAMLLRAGFTALYDYKGGMVGGEGDPGWVAAGGAVATAPEPGRTYRELCGA